jgi:hypothetical protein
MFQKARIDFENIKFVSQDQEHRKRNLCRKSTQQKNTKWAWPASAL